MPRRRRPALTASAPNHDRWLVSYADFITLLFAFFTTLYAMSVTDAQKAERLVQAILQVESRGIADASPAAGGGR